MVEDEARLRKVLARQLSANGFEVCEAMDGSAALQLLAERPDLLLLDRICRTSMAFNSYAHCAAAEATFQSCQSWYCPLLARQ